MDDATPPGREVLHIVTEASKVRSEFAIPDGHRVYAVGDIHGHADLLDRLLDLIDRDIEENPGPTVTEVFLGDYVDRGPDSKGVIQRLASRPKQERRRICIRGNHEYYVERFLSDPGVLHEWAANGGIATLQSYGVNIDAVAPDVSRIHREFVAAFPRQHEDFLTDLAAAFQLGDLFFTHAGIRPNVSINEQDAHDLMMIRKDFLNVEGPLPVRVIHGHTPAREPVVTPYRIGVDTGAFATGVLTACVLEGTNHRFLATDGFASDGR